MEHIHWRQAMRMPETRDVITMLICVLVGALVWSASGDWRYGLGTFLGLTAVIFGVEKDREP